MIRATGYPLRTRVYTGFGSRPGEVMFRCFGGAVSVIAGLFLVLKGRSAERDHMGRAAAPEMII